MRILLVFLFLFSPLAVSAQSVLINEIAWMGTPVAGVEEKQWWRYEWFELYNSFDVAVSLDDWTVELLRDNLDFTVSLKGTIVANGYYVVGASDKIPNLDLNYKNLGGKFNNSGQRVVLKNSLGEIVDEVNALSGWPAGDNKTKQTMERTQGSEPCKDQCWQTSVEPGGTPKAPNSKGVQLNLIKDETKLSLSKDENEVKLRQVKEQTEKDLSGSSQLVKLNEIKNFESRVSIVNPITLLAGFLALGFSGVLLLVKRSLASRQERQKS